MSLNDIDMSGIEEPKDFGLVKPCVTRLRIREITKITEGLDEKAYDCYYRVLSELSDPSSVEPVDPDTVPSAPITNLYVHNKGSLGVLRHFIEAHGFSWDDFIGSPDREGFLQGLVGAEADAKIVLTTTTNGNQRNEAKYKAVKKTV